MQPDLPWNVAGIPSEAREAARASARRQGLSVGEWLTRRILSSFGEGGENFEVNAQAWRAESSPAAQAAARESEDMLAHVSRSESETQNAYRRIEEHLRVLGRRLDATERSQSENSRAMGKAATEISIASREQAQAFDQLGTHVVGLSERLKRLEQNTANDGLRDAVKALHQGLSRLADQIATTANQSASQIAAVAGNVEAVAAKLAQARLESENLTQALDGRINAVDERIRHIEQNDALAQVSGTVNGLATQLSTNDAKTSGTITRLEESIAKLEARLPEERRLQSIEHALADATSRLDNAEHRDFESTLRALSARLDDAEKRQRESVAELQNAIRDATPRAEPAPQMAYSAPPAPQPAPTMAPPPMAQPTMAQAMAAPAAMFDLPPFPDSAPFPSAEPFGAPPPPPPFDGGYGADAGFGATPQGNESYLAAARRSARDAAAAQAETRAGFSWGAAPRPAAEAPKRSRTRFALIGSIILIAAAAMVAGVLLSRSQHPKVAPHSIGALFSKPVATVAKPMIGNILPPQTTKPAAQAEAPAARIEVAPVAQPKPLAEKPATKPTASLSPQDRVTALANSGNATAQLLLGLKYLDGEGTAVNEAEAARWFERAAKQNNPIAEYRLGTLYERGRGVAADAKKAAQWYGAAANLGNRKAMHNLAVAYAQGSGVTKDFTQAAQWFSKAANLGLSDSQFNLAVLYERGMGVPQSLLDAYKWYAVAASQGDAESKSRIDALTTQLSPDDRAAAQRSADTFKPKPMDPASNVAPDISALPPA